MTQARRWSVVWTLIVLSSALYFFSDNEADNDLWVHVRIGLDVLASGVPRVDTYSYTAAGGAWIDHEWLLHALFGGLYRVGGSPALLLFKLAVGLATLGLLGRSVARRVPSVHVRGASLVLASAVLARGFAVRPQVVTYFAIAALWAFLDDERRRDSGRRWLLVPAFVLWVNLHGGVLLGVAMSGLCAAWIFVRHPRQGFLLGLAVAVAVAAGLLFNPYGPSYAGYVWRELGMPHPITEWQRVALEPAQASFFLLALLFLASLPVLQRWRERGWEALLALLLLAAALLQQRHTPAFALCAVPLAAEGMARLAAAVRRRRTWALSSEAQWLVVGGIAIVAVVQLAATAERLSRDHLRIVFSAGEYPVAAVRVLEAAAVEANLAVPLEWGGYALWHLGPRVKVSLDGRFAMVYPHATVEENFAFFSGREGWKSLIEAHPTDAVLAPSGALPPIQSTRGWRRAYSDPVATLITREGSAVDLAVGSAVAAPVEDPAPFP